MRKRKAKLTPSNPGEETYLKFFSAWIPHTDDWLVFNGQTVIEKNLSEDAATRLAQFLNAAEYLNTSPSERAKRPEKINFDFNAIYEIYPRKIGKASGIERLKRKITTPEKYTLLIQAVKHYAELMSGTEERFIMHFSTWAGKWEDSLPEDASTGQQESLTLDEINKLIV
jgi:hypothetical protein